MQNGCVRTKKIALDFVFPGGLQPPNTEGLTRSRCTLPRTYQPRKGRFESGLFWFLWLVWFNQINEINQRNQSNRSVRYGRRSRPWGVVRSWSGPRGTIRVGLMSSWVM